MTSDLADLPLGTRIRVNHTALPSGHGSCYLTRIVGKRIGSKNEYYIEVQSGWGWKMDKAHTWGFELLPSAEIDDQARYWYIWSSRINSVVG